MCGRFRQTRSQKHLKDFFHADGDIEVVPRFNIAPTDPLVTVRQEKGKASRQLSIMRWGLIPSWAKDISHGNQTINARSETVTSKLSFSESVRYRRCLIPAERNCLPLGLRRRQFLLPGVPPLGRNDSRTMAAAPKELAVQDAITRRRSVIKCRAGWRRKLYSSMSINARMSSNLPLPDDGGNAEVNQPVRKRFP
jgi:SOS response associated peptidase (SRAP)